MSAYGDYLITSGHYDITPEQEREIEAREECERLGIDPDEVCADGGVLAWMVVDRQFVRPATREGYPEFSSLPPATSKAKQAEEAI